MGMNGWVLSDWELVNAPPELREEKWQHTGRSLLRLNAGPSMLVWLWVFERRRTDLQSVCVAGCAVIHCAVIGCLQVDYHQRAVLCFVFAHISSDVKMLSESFLQLCVAVVNVSDAFQSPAFRVFLKPVHEPVVGFVVAADQMDCVSRASEEIGRSLTDLNTETNAW